MKFSNPFAPPLNSNPRSAFSFSFEINLTVWGTTIHVTTVYKSIETPMSRCRLDTDPIRKCRIDAIWGVDKGCEGCILSLHWKSIIFSIFVFLSPLRPTYGFNNVFQCYSIRIITFPGSTLLLIDTVKSMTVKPIYVSKNAYGAPFNKMDYI